jgi:4-hydroxymandelate synthase
MRLDAVEIWVTDLRMTSDVLTTALGFAPVTVPVPAEPYEDVGVLACGGATIVLRQGRSDRSRVAAHVARHGDTVADVHLVGAEAPQVAERARTHGLAVSGPPASLRVDLLGDGTICHSLRSQPLVDRRVDAAGPMIRSIDHVAYCLPHGSMESVAGVYEQVFDLERVDVGDAERVGDEDATGMRSTALRSREGFTVVLTEPLMADGAGQTQRFLQAHAGAGVQHAALAYDDVLTAVRTLQPRGMRFLTVPPEYYDEARRRLAHAPLPWDELSELGVLVDAEADGLLFQLFSEPLSARPTFFFEFIQRVGATGFGANNVRALFAAVEQAMARSAAVLER